MTNSTPTKSCRSDTTSPRTEYRQSCIRREMLIGQAATAARSTQRSDLAPAGSCSLKASGVGWACDQAKAFFSLLAHGEGGDLNWNDDRLMSHSAAVLSAAPDKWVALHMRARVLSADEHAAWDAYLPRSREDLMAAAICFTRASELARTQGREASLLRQASACVERADTLGPLGTGSGLCCC